MKRFVPFLWALIVGVVLLPTSASAQMVTVPQTVKVDGPGLVVIRASAVDADVVRWYSIGSSMQTFPEDVIKPTLGTYVGLAMREGVYKVGLISAKAINGKAVISEPQEIVITVGSPDPAPTPTPGPGPTPPPAPTPAAAKLFVVVIKDLNTDTPQLAKLLNSDNLSKLYTSKGHVFKLYDKSSDAVTTFGFTPFITKAGSLPCLILMEAEGPDRGKVRASIPLPATEQGVIDALKAAGGA